MSIITIQRGTKSGGEGLAQCVAEALGYPAVGEEVLEDAAAQLGVPPEDVGHQMEDRPGLFGRTPLITRLYVAAVRAALADHARDGNLVYHGLAGGFLLRSLPGVLRLRLIAPVEARIRTLMETHGMDEASAEAYIQDVDHARETWVKNVYGQDIYDSTRYDMVLNLGSFSIPEACEVVVTAASRPEFEMTEARSRELKDFRIACQVRLALLEDLGTQTLDLDATVTNGLARVTGEAPVMNTEDVGKRITEIVSAISGVTEVRLSIEWFDPYP